jgi:nucleotide-binding universal stress UspA family protein
MSNLLLAIGDEDRPYATLNYASKVATSLGATLHILRMLPPLADHFTAERPRMADARARRNIDRCIAACRQTRASYQKVLGVTLPTQRLHIRVGELANEVVRQATELDVLLVVLAASTQQLGPTTTALARACSKPVLVARGAAPSGPIIAATDPNDDTHRIIGYSKELSVILKAPVVAVRPDVGSARGLGTIFRRVPETAASLESRAADAHEPLCPVTMSVTDRVDAILAEATRHRSGLIVVGTGQPGSNASPQSDPLAEELVDRARCSVLVAPRPRDGSASREGAALAPTSRSQRA